MFYVNYVYVWDNRNNNRCEIDVLCKICMYIMYGIKYVSRIHAKFQKAQKKRFINVSASFPEKSSNL